MKSWRKSERYVVGSCRKMFLHPRLLQDYRAGRLLTGQLKARCIKVLQEFTSSFQAVCDCISPNKVRTDRTLSCYSAEKRLQMKKSKRSWMRIDKSCKLQDSKLIPRSYIVIS